MDIEKLKRRKKALNLTTAEIAYRAELPVSTVSKVFTGETRNPSYTTIEAIMDVLVKEESYHRIVAYYEAFYEYLNKNKGEVITEAEFEKKYRKDNDLSDMPIRLAVKKGTEEEYADDFILTNLAAKKNALLCMDEYLTMNTGERDELIHGKIVYNQAPRRAHQDMVRLLGKRIDRFIDSNKGKCIVYDGGINVELDEYNCLIPDIAVICEKKKLTEVGICGGPDWVIEVTSPGTRRRDYREKALLYLTNDTKEYWIVDMERKAVAVYLAGEPIFTHLYSFEDQIPVELYDGKLTIRPADSVNVDGSNDTL